MGTGNSTCPSIPKESSMRLAPTSPLYVVLASLFLASAALAQSGPELLLKPFPKELTADIDGTALFTDSGHSKETGASTHINIYDLDGRFRLNPGDVASPRIGFGLKYFTIDSALPGLPRDFSDQ